MTARRASNELAGEAWASESEIATRQLNKARKEVMQASEIASVSQQTPLSAPLFLPLEGTTRLNPEVRVFDN